MTYRKLKKILRHATIEELNQPVFVFIEKHQKYFEVKKVQTEIDIKKQMTRLVLVIGEEK